MLPHVHDHQLSASQRWNPNSASVKTTTSTISQQQTLAWTSSDCQTTKTNNTSAPNFSTQSTQKQVFNSHDHHHYSIISSFLYLLLFTGLIILPLLFIKEFAIVRAIIDCYDNRLIIYFEEPLCLNTHPKESHQLVHSVKANSTCIIEPQE